MSRLITSSTLTALTLTAAWWIRRNFVVITVSGLSMTPTLKTGDRVLIRRGTRNLRRGGIVVIARPAMVTGWRDNPPVGRAPKGTRWYIKRAVALAGDPYPPRAGSKGVVPDDHILVIGDGPQSIDSKQHGPCPRDQILGVVVHRFQRTAVSAPVPSAD
ncbi:S26 family signal peptidase [Streptosporangium sp. CA-135522]|uniref:S26 family signal peptidase n=1 Tax=Streptosporangium sp. CA-135522 TaxID=3240072 RepID=UPI003D924EDB